MITKSSLWNIGKPVIENNKLTSTSCDNGLLIDRSLASALRGLTISCKVNEQEISNDNFHIKKYKSDSSVLSDDLP